MQGKLCASISPLVFMLLRRFHGDGPDEKGVPLKLGSYYCNLKVYDP